MSDLIKDWVTKAGYRAVIVKHSGYHCGYVSIPPVHPLFGIDYTDMEFDPDVHGGITYSGDRREKGTWWYGFDCNHLYDTILQCNEPYVVRECEWLAKQLRDIEPLCESEVTEWLNGKSSARPTSLRLT
jgi:hypothetical protein